MATMFPNSGLEDPFAGVDFSELDRSLRRPRTLMDFILNAATTVATLAALIPLFSVVFMLVWRGGQRLSLEVFTHLPPAPLEQGGGFGNAVLGTLVMVGMAMLMSVPMGLLTAIYLSQTSKGKVAETVRFAAKVLTGFPSILAGVFAYGAVVLATGRFSAFAGAVALAVLMLPTIVLTSEDSDPNDLDGLAADRVPGNPHGHHARCRTRRGGNRAPHPHRTV